MSLVKLVVLGDGGVGKSALIIQFVRNQFVLHYDPTIEANYRKQLLIDETAVMLDILDTAGQEDYAVMRDQYIRAGQGFLLVYSVTDEASFLSLRQLRNKIVSVLDYDDFPLVLTGNKSDINDQRQVSKETGQALADEWKVPFFESSAKLRTNVDECFERLTKLVMLDREQNQAELTASGSPSIGDSNGGAQSGPIPASARKKQGGGCVLL